MRTPRTPYCWAVLVTAGLLLLAPGIASARPIRTLDLDRDVPEADLIAIVKVSSSTFQKEGWFLEQMRGRRTPTPANEGYRVDFHEVKGVVVHPIKNAGTTGREISFRHRREPASGHSVPNGFMSHPFEPGQIYLLVLRKESDGVLAVPAPEQWFYPTFTDAMIGELPKRLPEESDLDYILRLLLARFEAGEKPDEVGVESLVMLMRTKAGLPLAEERSRAASLCRRLQLIVSRDLGTGVHGGVLRTLKELGQPVPTEQIVEWILDKKLAPSVRMNLVGMLSLAPTTDQLAAMERLIKDLGNEDVLKAVVRQRTYARALLKREQEAERRIRESKQR